MQLVSQAVQRVAGFEASDYALLDGRLVWLGGGTGTAHPRNARRPWTAPQRRFDARALQIGARRCRRLIDTLPPKGLLLWLVAQPLPFPLQLAAARFDAIGAALERNDINDFGAAALRVLGLGPGLTPSGDDFVGGVFFGLVHAPRGAWAVELLALRGAVRAAARQSTNAISAALLDDLIDGSSFAPLHSLLGALQDDDPVAIRGALHSLLDVGANSGADMLAGLLLALLTLPPSDTNPPP